MKSYMYSSPDINCNDHIEGGEITHAQDGNQTQKHSEY
jgi:hypothetical protein